VVQVYNTVTVSFSEFWQATTYILLKTDSCRHRLKTLVFSMQTIKTYVDHFCMSVRGGRAYTA